MNNSDGFSNESSTQFALSYELLCLLRWLSEYDDDKLKKIITEAMNTGLQEELRKINRDNHELMLLDDMQHSITDFFGLLEALLHEVINEQVEKKAREKDLLPALEHIDSTICDDTIVRSCLEKATSKLEGNPESNAKELLYKELLKRWKPHDKDIKN